MSPRTPRPPAEKAHRADMRWQRLIHHLEDALGSKNADERRSAAEQLSKLLLADAAHKNDAAERALRLKELEFKKGVPAPAADLDATIAKLEAEVAAKKAKVDPFA